LSDKQPEHPLVGVAREMNARSRESYRRAGAVVRATYWQGLCKDLKRGNPNAWTDYALRLSLLPELPEDGTR
jgi:hypothetical protein